ncbi:hypothetical protein MUA01_15485 [Enterobacteriaceae bacterium H18W14]|uniref:O-antigen polymerase n=1 Tax=Dryocola boscaweniae TaxID=2925397 RepID=UPI0022F0CF62|nr:O-antigen polymerase [Dryocola boscaweniae]MCT4716365.1 hypothetical protein [Dryocola boscaweniae]
MDKLAFAELYASNLAIGLPITLIVILCVYFILRKQIYSLFDPMNFLIIAGGSGYSVVFFLYYLGYITDYYFYSFLATQTAFFLGVISNQKKSLKKIYLTQQASLPPYSGLITVIYPLSVMLFITCQFIVYYTSGIPLLMASRLEIFSGGGGFGMVNRIIQVTQVIAIAVAFYRLLFINKGILYKLIDFLVIIFGLLVAVLSGSKSAILFMIFSLSYVAIFAHRFNVSPKIFKKINRLSFFLLMLGMIGGIVTIVYQTNNSDLNKALSVLAMRFINTGDIYYMAYPYDQIENMEPGNFFLALFKDFFGAFRIIGWDKLPVNLGLQIFWSYYNTDMVSGPNPRHNVFGLFYLGPILSVLYSFVIGYTISYIRNKILLKTTPDFLGLIFYVLLASNTIYMEQDMTYALGQLISILMVYLPLYVFSRFMAFASHRPRAINE